MISPAYFVFLTLLNFGAQRVTDRPFLPVQLNYQEYWVSPRTTYESFNVRIQVRGNDTITIDRAVPSCGCVMATIQKNRATKQRPGEVYVAITSRNVDPLQPVTIDIYTSDNRSVPKRVYIRRSPIRRTAR
jgi:hypothetical protein